MNINGEAVISSVSMEWADDHCQSKIVCRRLKKITEQKKKLAARRILVENSFYARIRKLCAQGLPPKHIWIRCKMHWFGQSHKENDDLSFAPTEIANRKDHFAVNNQMASAGHSTVS